MPCIAATECFLLKERNKFIQQEGDCDAKYAPASTFKIALSLIGYDAGILQDELHPEWPFKEHYREVLGPIWQQPGAERPQNPTTWMKYSCIWYSQVLTQKLGMNKLKVYVKKFGYGNQDLSGDKEANNGLTHSWLSSSLEISPLEQAEFLNKLLNCKLPINAKACNMTKRILFVEDLPDGWKLYGKTGTGYLFDDKRQVTKLQHGWFVGWIEKDNRAIIFVHHVIEDELQSALSAGRRTKEKAKERLLKLVEQLK